MKLLAVFVHGEIPRIMELFQRTCSDDPVNILRDGTCHSLLVDSEYLRLCVSASSSALTRIIENLQCGSVKGIEVYKNEGGVTKYVGGWRWFIIPAGYVGGSFWGGFFTVMSGNRWASLASACVFCTAMAVSMFFSPNKTMVFLNLGFIILTVGFILIDQFLLHPFLQFLTLFYGVFIGSFSIFDIYDDLITRTVEGSDAHACHKLIPCCLPRCVGVQFMVVALAFQAGALYLALVWMGSV